MTTVVPLDPASPKGIAVAEKLEKTLGEIWYAICQRRAARAAAPEPLRRAA